jgi:hypothetical protein
MAGQRGTGVAFLSVKVKRRASRAPVQSKTKGLKEELNYGSRIRKLPKETMR